MAINPKKQQTEKKDKTAQDNNLVPDPSAAADNKPSMNPDMLAKMAGQEAANEATPITGADLDNSYDSIITAGAKSTASANRTLDALEKNPPN